jgi:hypothetical protein
MMDVEATLKAIELLENIKHPPIDASAPVIVYRARPINTVALRYIDDAIWYLNQSLHNYLNPDR